LSAAGAATPVAATPVPTILSSRRRRICGIAAKSGAETRPCDGGPGDGPEAVALRARPGAARSKTHFSSRCLQQRTVPAWGKEDTRVVTCRVVTQAKSQPGAADVARVAAPEGPEAPGEGADAGFQPATQDVLGTRASLQEAAIPRCMLCLKGQAATSTCQKAGLASRTATLWCPRC
jgi:hypothetical protein